MVISSKISRASVCGASGPDFHGQECSPAASSEDNAQLSSVSPEHFEQSPESRTRSPFAIIDISQDFDGALRESNILTCTCSCASMNG